jgi:hypothetical protein
VSLLIEVSPIIFDDVSPPIMLDDVSDIEGELIMFDEVSLIVLSVVVELSLPLPQAAKTPAIAIAAKNFFIVLEFLCV